MSTRQFGARVERNIDPKLLKGEGRFVDDIPLPQALHAAFVRSPFSARTYPLDQRQPRRRSIRAWSRSTPATISAISISTMPLLIPHPSMKHPHTQRPLARGRRLLRRPVHRHGGCGRPLRRRRRRGADRRSTTIRSTSKSTSRRRCATARRWSMPTRRTISRRILSRSAAIPMTPSPRPSTSPRSGADRSLDGGADGMPGDRGELGRRFRRS